MRPRVFSSKSGALAHRKEDVWVAKNLYFWFWRLSQNCKKPTWVEYSVIDLHRMYLG